MQDWPPRIQKKHIYMNRTRLMLTETFLNLQDGWSLPAWLEGYGRLSGLPRSYRAGETGGGRWVTAGPDCHFTPAACCDCPDSASSRPSSPPRHYAEMSTASLRPPGQCHPRQFELIIAAALRADCTKWTTPPRVDCTTRIIS